MIFEIKLKKSSGLWTWGCLFISSMVWNNTNGTNLTNTQWLPSYEPHALLLMDFLLLHNLFTTRNRPIIWSNTDDFACCTTQQIIKNNVTIYSFLLFERLTNSFERSHVFNPGPVTALVGLLVPVRDAECLMHKKQSYS